MKKKIAELAARAAFVNLFLVQKQLIFNFLTQKELPRFAPFAGGMKFAAQISPLLIFIVSDQFYCTTMKHYYGQFYRLSNQHLSKANVQQFNSLPRQKR